MLLIIILTTIYSYAQSVSVSVQMALCSCCTPRPCLSANLESLMIDLLIRDASELAAIARFLSLVVVMSLSNILIAVGSMCTCN